VPARPLTLRPSCPLCPSFPPAAEYGSFFLSWYSGLLIQHADLLLGATKQVLSQRCRPRAIREARELSDGGMLYVFEPAVQLGIKLAGVHWWFKSRTHAAELTAGYYNTRERNGYLPIFEMLKRHSATASFTCVEMRDCEHPTEGRCSPEGLLNQVRGQAQVWWGGRGWVQWLLVLLWGWLWLALATHTAADLAASPHAWPSFLLQVLSTAARVGLPMSGENALQRYDQCAFDKICDSAFGQSVMAGRLEVRARVCVEDCLLVNCGNKRQQPSGQPLLLLQIASSAPYCSLLPPLTCPYSCPVTCCRS
jgi:beta-amylase